MNRVRDAMLREWGRSACTAGRHRIALFASRDRAAGFVLQPSRGGASQESSTVVQLYDNILDCIKLKTGKSRFQNLRIPCSFPCSQGSQIRRK
jgi:hypothetical protein